ncbi:hypothetical protein DH2020_017000 [Rehmannia glutinosa]|uniref:sucrose synthase n=1 Tax=Rehmannia glutinosa TaxID=99300 RepID=A0ABR0WTW6_REHGL
MADQCLLVNGHGIKENLENAILFHPDEILRLRSRLESQGKGIVKPVDLLNHGEKTTSCVLGNVLKSSQEAVVISPQVALAVRPRPGVWEYLLLNLEELAVTRLSVSQYLQFKERVVDDEGNGFELDFKPFNALTPRQTLSSSIGNGLEFLNRLIASKMFNDKEILQHLLDFLRSHNYKGQSLLLNYSIDSLEALQNVLRKAGEYLQALSPETPYSQFEQIFHENGLERGWGDTAGRVLEMINHLLLLLEAPDACTVHKFLGKIPTVFNVVILSPHGYFAQENVLGYPDTGGQVVYILDQVPAMESEMLERLKQQGLDIIPRILIVTRLLPDAVGTTCNQRLEKVYKTEYSHILRVPFRTDKGIVRKWISRFEVWPYMETFTEDAAKEIVGELDAKPDLIIGNYSEGNLVSSLLANKFGATQCTIAHALEKTKYSDSDIYWKKYDDKYHFSSQFTADLFAMNKTDFIITSTFQEIAGRCVLKDRNKPILFTMARLDRVKNLTGLVEWYAKNSKLRKLVNLVVVGGDRRKESKDLEEQAEMKKMYQLIETYNLNGEFRWISSQMNRVRNGELYRYVADTRGAFVQPAFYEAFGLTVIESMTCGLPTFATCNGGPAEIIVNGKSGFHIDPNNGDEAARIIVHFFEKCKDEPSYWDTISVGGIQRILDKYTWKIFAEKMLDLGGVYGFWKYATKNSSLEIARLEIARYLEMLYELVYRKSAEKVPLAVE